MRKRRLREPLLAVALIALLSAPLASQTAGAPELVRQGSELLGAGDYHGAVGRFLEALTLNPNYLQALLGLAESYYWLGEYDRARHHAEQAVRLSRSDTAALNLSGLIAMGSGDLFAAEQFFRQVERLEPNNVGARVGLAELALARGRSAEARAELEAALRLNPLHRKALLSLVLVAEYEGDAQRAADYLEVALAVHREVPEVHVLAAEYYLRSGDLVAAARAARTAQSLDARNVAAAELRARVALLQDTPREVLAITAELIARDRTNTQAWYLRAAASHRLGDTEGALAAIRTLLRANPDAAIARVWGEAVALESLPLDDAVRAEFAAYRSSSARQLAAGFRYSRALSAYQRALQLSPLDPDLRAEYADLHRRIGNAGTYISEMEIARANGLTSAAALRQVEVYRSVRTGSVAARWRVDQFTMPRDLTSMALYLAPGGAPPGYPSSEASLLDFVARALRSRGLLDVVVLSTSSGFSDAFAASRSFGVDYFAEVRFGGTERVTTIDVQVYVARTGGAATTVRAVRTGPDHVEAAVDAVAEQLTGFPVNARIVARRGDTVLLDRGLRDGLSAGDVLVVLRSGAATPAPTSVGVIYDESAVLGEVTLTRLDDLLAEGTVRRSGIVDLVRAGDTALLERDLAAAPAVPSLVPMLYERVRRLR